MEQIEIAGKKYFCTKKVAEILGITPGTMANWRSKTLKKGPSVHKIGGRCYYLEDDLNTWIQQQKFVYEK